MTKSQKNFEVNEITDIDEDFAKWYTDIVKKAELVDYSPTRGCTVFRPYGWAIWENIRNILDSKFKETGHENVSMPLLIPESLLQKEKDHVEGFAPEVAWVTHGGTKKLDERLCVRPTSEALFCEHFSRIVHSWRDLPKLYNQWCSVVRWEKTSRPFLRGVEFHWQEGHTLHETAEEALEETRKMHNIYADFCENYLAIPVIKGVKTENEKFAGAVKTYTIECMMHDGKALQSGTSHYFGTRFSEAFGISFTNRENKSAFPHGTSWGFTTRCIGGIIMVHGDNNGLVLPPKIAPIQIVIIPIASNKPSVIEKCEEIFKKLSQEKNFRVKFDKSSQTPGWKFAEYEMKGVPLRIEIGPRDIEKNECIFVRRDNFEKKSVNLNNLSSEIEKTLSQIHENLYQKALQRLHDFTHVVTDYQQLSDFSNTKKGFFKAMWCGNSECELKVKDELGLTIRCIPLEEERVSEVCVCCGAKAENQVYFAKAY